MSAFPSIQEGRYPQGQGRVGIWDWFRHIIVPATILGFGGVIVYTRFVRSQVLEVLSQDHVRTARAKGLREGHVAQWHVLRNALIPVVTLLGSFLPFLISGAAITESIFNWPGMGRLFLEAATTRDYPAPPRHPEPRDRRDDGRYLHRRRHVRNRRSPDPL